MCVCFSNAWAFYGVCSVFSVRLLLTVILSNEQNRVFESKVALVTISAICVCCMNVWLHVYAEEDGDACGLNASAPSLLNYLFYSQQKDWLLGYNSLQDEIRGVHFQWTKCVS